MSPATSPTAPPSDALADARQRGLDLLLWSAPGNTDAAPTPDAARAALALRGPHRLWELRGPRAHATGSPARVVALEELACSAPLLVIAERGATPSAGWLDALLAHAPRAGDGGAIGVSTNADPLQAAWTPHSADRSAERWLECMARLHRLWHAGAEDVDECTSPLLVLVQPARHASALHAWATALDPEPLELGVAARLVVARDVAAWRDPDHASAAQLCARARDPEVPAAQRLESLHDLRRVQGELGDLLERGPRPHARLRLAELCNLTGQHARAAEHARACLAQWRDHLRATLQLAEALGLGGHGHRARALLEQIAERAPVTPHVRAHLLACTGEAWRRSGDGAQADECFGAALLLEPGQVLALNGRARLAMEAGDFDAATRDLLVAAQAEPLRADTWSNLGRALVLSGAHEQGSSMLARALSINPTHREARVLLERVALMRGPRHRACG
ncbi:MAG: hypothetical protein EPO68_10385 [Planctomycetota bacterium]|nr:MAG: hypothetical protein EPO68_10385 [Planctomycetota bacterium]